MCACVRARCDAAVSRCVYMSILVSHSVLNSRPHTSQQTPGPVRVHSKNIHLSVCVCRCRRATTAAASTTSRARSFKCISFINFGGNNAYNAYAYTADQSSTQLSFNTHAYRIRETHTRAHPNRQIFVSIYTSKSHTQ